MGNNIVRARVSSCQEIKTQRGIGLKMVLALTSITPVTGLGENRKFGEKCVFDGTVLTQEIIWSDAKANELLAQGFGQGANISIEALGVEALTEEHEALAETAQMVGELSGESRRNILDEMSREERNHYFNFYTAAGVAKRQLSGARWNTVTVEQRAPRTDDSVATKPVTSKVKAEEAVKA